MRVETNTAHLIRNTVALGVALLFLWLTIQIDLIIFAGILLAVFLRGVSRIIGDRTGLSSGVALTLVIAGIIIIVAAVGWLFAAQVNSQMTQLSQQLPAAINHWKRMIGGIPWLSQMINKTPLISGAGTMGQVFGAATTTIDAVVGFVVFLVIGIYGAAEAGLYRRGALRLVPVVRRARAAEILDETAELLWFWMIGRLFSVTVIGITTGVALWLIGVPVPAMLGVLAGILTFVPYVGTILSSLPPILLAATIDPFLVIYVILIFIGIHLLEGYVLIPLVQKRATHLPPALTLSAQAIFWVLAGPIGIALAMPLTATAMIMVRMIYVEDMLGDKGTPTAG